MQPVFFIQIDTSAVRVVSYLYDGNLSPEQVTLLCYFIQKLKKVMNDKGAEGVAIRMVATRSLPKKKSSTDKKLKILLFLGKN